VERVHAEGEGADRADPRLGVASGGAITLALHGGPLRLPHFGLCTQLGWWLLSGHSALDVPAPVVRGSDDLRGVGIRRRLSGYIVGHGGVTALTGHSGSQ